MHCGGADAPAAIGNGDASASERPARSRDRRHLAELGKAAPQLAVERMLDGGSGARATAAGAVQSDRDAVRAHVNNFDRATVRRHDRANRVIDSVGDLGGATRARRPARRRRDAGLKGLAQDCLDTRSDGLPVASRRLANIDTKVSDLDCTDLRDVLEDTSCEWRIVGIVTVGTERLDLAKPFVVHDPPSYIWIVGSLYVHQRDHDHLIP